MSYMTADLRLCFPGRARAVAARLPVPPAGVVFLEVWVPGVSLVVDAPGVSLMEGARLLGAVLNMVSPFPRAISAVDLSMSISIARYSSW